jgi:hypothetical protein
MRMVKATLFGLLLVSGLGACAAPGSYTADNLDARVVDAETKQPIAGVVVVASWTLTRASTMEPSYVGSVKSEEAITDESGRFHLAGWGPIPRPRSGILDVLDPEFVLFKPGYLAAYKSNYNPATPIYTGVERSARTSTWNGKDIELERDSGDRARYANTFIRAFVPLQVVYNFPACNWKQIPLAVHAFEQERLRQLKLERPLHVVPPLKLMLASRDCQPTDEFMKAYEAIR